MAKSDIENLYERVDALERLIRKQYQAPTLPIYDSTNFPQDSVEGQIAVTSDNRAFIYINGAWRPVAGLRIVHGGFVGTLSSDITNPGSGDWTLGDYLGAALITFNTPFSNPPTVTITAGSSNDHVNGVPIVNADNDGDEFADHFSVRIQDPETGNNVDFVNGWYFQAIGT